MQEKIEIINNWNINKLINQLESGNIKIPKFQRDYKWERSKICKLLNSIYNQYPIGSFFLWVAPKEYKHFCKEIAHFNLPDKPEASEFQFILDGQQRITSLYVALKGLKIDNVDYSSICFNLKKREFHLPNLKTEKHNIPAWKLFDTTAHALVYNEYSKYDEQNGSNYANAWLECQQIFTNYPISVVKSLNMQLDEVVEIFERINQGGKRLSLFDLVHATTWSPDFDLRTRIKEFNSQINIKHFGELPEEVFSQSLSLNTFDACTNAHQLRLKASDCLAIWDKTVKSISLSIDFLKTLGVKYFELIPYPAFVPLIQYYYKISGYNSMKAEHKKLIEDWFWTSTFSQKYSSTTLTKMGQDALWISKMISENSHEANLSPVSLTAKDILKIQMKTKSVLKNGIFCLMALAEPKDFNNGDLVVLDKSQIANTNSKENHHIFPSSQREQFGENVEINLLLNYAFMKWIPIVGQIC